MGDEFITVQNEAQGKLLEKKSKFIAYVRPVEIEQQALGLINEIRCKHFDASHNVYAYSIRENNIQRYSDDGEPSGTAGIPVLEAIKVQGLTNVAVVVTRYFGGTLLGTGGLVRAYGAVARIGLEEATPITKMLCNTYSVKCEYGMLGRLQYDISEANYIIENIEYNESVVINVCVKAEFVEKFRKMIINSSLGRAIIERTGSKYISLKREDI